MPQETDIPALPRLLLVDDDEIFGDVLASALRSREFEVHIARTVAEGKALADQIEPEYAVIDLRIENESGLALVEYLHQLDENTRSVVLTGFASIATAVEAIKLGAIHYLTKPTDADAVAAALHKDTGNAAVEISENPISVKRLEWEHLQKVLMDNDGNVSAAARALNMHRRTLQRKLAKRPVKE